MKNALKSKQIGRKCSLNNILIVNKFKKRLFDSKHVDLFRRFTFVYISDQKKH